MALWGLTKGRGIWYRGIMWSRHYVIATLCDRGIVRSRHCEIATLWDRGFVGLLTLGSRPYRIVAYVIAGLWARGRTVCLFLMMVHTNENAGFFLPMMTVIASLSVRLWTCLFVTMPNWGSGATEGKLMPMMILVLYWVWSSYTYDDTSTESETLRSTAGFLFLRRYEAL